MKKFVLLIVVFSACLFRLYVYAESKYPETTTVLQRSYDGEVQAFRNYLAFAQKAESEGYSSVAYLFTSLANSESVHARNFKNLLSDLGVEVKDKLKLEIKVSKTKTNLNRALDIELKEIDRQYPNFIERIKHENHKAAIENLTFAWKSEKQHKELIKKIRSATKFFFWKIVKELKKADRYFVCQGCGSTLVKLPEHSCPICGDSASQYKQVK